MFGVIAVAIWLDARTGIMRGRRFDGVEACDSAMACLDKGDAGLVSWRAGDQRGESSKHLDGLLSSPLGRMALSRVSRDLADPTREGMEGWAPCDIPCRCEHSQHDGECHGQGLIPAAYVGAVCQGCAEGCIPGYIKEGGSFPVDFLPASYVMRSCECGRAFPRVENVIIGWEDYKGRREPVTEDQCFTKCSSCRGELERASEKMEECTYSKGWQYSVGEHPSEACYEEESFLSSATQRQSQWRAPRGGYCWACD